MTVNPFYLSPMSINLYKHNKRENWYSTKTTVLENLNTCVGLNPQRFPSKPAEPRNVARSTYLQLHNIVNYRNIVPQLQKTFTVKLNTYL